MGTVHAGSWRQLWGAPSPLTSWLPVEAPALLGAHRWLFLWRSLGCQGHCRGMDMVPKAGVRKPVHVLLCCGAAQCPWLGEAGEAPGLLPLSSVSVPEPSGVPGRSQTSDQTPGGGSTVATGQRGLALGKCLSRSVSDRAPVIHRIPICRFNQLQIRNIREQTAVYSKHVDFLKLSCC